MYWLATRFVWLAEGRDLIPNLSGFTSRFGLLELVIRELSAEFQPTIDRIRAEIGLGTMSNPQEVSSGSEGTHTNEFRVVRRDTDEEASVGSSRVFHEALRRAVDLGDVRDAPSEGGEDQATEAEVPDKEEEEEEGDEWSQHNAVEKPTVLTREKVLELKRAF